MRSTVGPAHRRPSANRVGRGAGPFGKCCASNVGSGSDHGERREREWGGEKSNSRKEKTHARRGGGGGGGLHFYYRPDRGGLVTWRSWSLERSDPGSERLRRAAPPGTSTVCGSTSASSNSSAGFFTYIYKPSGSFNQVGDSSDFFFFFKERKVHSRLRCAVACFLKEEKKNVTKVRSKSFHYFTDNFFFFFLMSLSSG